MDEYLKANKELWEAYVDIHEGSTFYDLKGFLKGKQTLDQIELDEIKDVSGKSLLHLQCHFGLDTLSWARLGARVTGVDFSDKAIKLAQRIRNSIGVEATFIQSNIYELSEKLHEQFDIVFTSGGVLTWLPDLDEWAKIVSRYLKPDGFFYIREFHPFAYIFDDEMEEPLLQVRYPYFQGKEPLVFESDASYASAEGERMKTKISYEWNHSISTILNALTKAGLRIEYFNEFPFTTWRALRFMVQNANGRYVLPEFESSIPFMFSIKATK